MKLQTSVLKYLLARLGGKNLYTTTSSVIVEKKIHFNQFRKLICLPKKKKMPKKKKGKRGRKDRLRDINDDIMAQLFAEKIGIEHSTSESNDDSIKSELNSESTPASMNLGSKTAAIILEEMIIGPSSSHCQKSQLVENMTSSFDSKLENEIASCVTYNTDSINKLKKTNSSRIYDSESLNFAPSVSKIKHEQHHSKKSKKRQNGQTQSLVDLLICQANYISCCISSKLQA
ncbi:hypothetical protein ACO02O_04284 [Dirofilaria immitis]